MQQLHVGSHSKHKSAKSFSGALWGVNRCGTLPEYPLIFCSELKTDILQSKHYLESGIRSYFLVGSAIVEVEQQIFFRIFGCSFWLKTDKFKCELHLFLLDPANTSSDLLKRRHHPHKYEHSQLRRSLLLSAKRTYSANSFWQQKHHAHFEFPQRLYIQSSTEHSFHLSRVSQNCNFRLVFNCTSLLQLG